MCLVEPVAQPIGAFVVAASVGDGARVVVRPRFGDLHVRNQWLSTVRAARDTLPPPEMTTTVIPDKFTGSLQYLGWVRLGDGSAEVAGAPVGARLAIAVTDHDVRLLRGVPRKAGDLDSLCVLRMPLASCRMSAALTAPIASLVVCSNELASSHTYLWVRM
eukprot:m.58747 g.58747  ORF g.58747 m.58747 type:complete len:161 (-) comp9428_c0_seq1:2766-3248(-)